MKIGDWVYYIGEDTPIQITKIDGNRIDCGDIETYIRFVELWKPKEGEWCWSKYDGLVQILKITDERYIVFPLSTSEKDCTIEYRLGGLEPFIGELPSFIKDKQ